MKALAASLFGAADAAEAQVRSIVPLVPSVTFNDLRLIDRLPQLFQLSGGVVYPSQENFNGLIMPYDSTSAIVTAHTDPATVSTVPRITGPSAGVERFLTTILKVTPSPYGPYSFLDMHRIDERSNLTQYQQSPEFVSIRARFNPYLEINNLEQGIYNEREAVVDNAANEGISNNSAMLFDFGGAMDQYQYHEHDLWALQMNVIGRVNGMNSWTKIVPSGTPVSGPHQGKRTYTASVYPDGDNVEVLRGIISRGKPNEPAMITKDYANPMVSASLTVGQPYSQLPSSIGTAIIATFLGPNQEYPFINWAALESRPKPY